MSLAAQIDLFSAYTQRMAGAKYSPGFDDPTADRRRGYRRVAGVVGTLLGVTALGVTFAAYLSPNFSMDLSGFMALCAQWIGLR